MFFTNPNELSAYRTDQRIWQGIPSIEVTPGGRIFSCFYSGNTTETLGNYCMVVMSSDGKTFSEPIAVSYFGEEHRCFDCCLWIDPLGRLWFTWSVMPDHALYGAICEDPDAETLVWGKEFFIGHNVMMNKPVVLTTGEWLFPVAVWNIPLLPESWKDKIHEPGAFVYRTCDNGKTFQRLGAAQMPDRSFDEHMIVELNDGRLMMWVRTMYGIGASYSWDRGKSWSRGENSGIASPSSRFHISRLKSGRLLLVNHKNFTGRNNLTAMLSDDDGKTWNEGLLLDERDGVAYPDVKEAADGFLYITYDHGRGAYKNCIEDAMREDREILFAKVTEADILAGKIISPNSELKMVISRLGEYKGSMKNPYRIPTLYKDRNYARHLLENYTGETIIGTIFDAYPINCVVIAEAQKLDNMISEFADSGYCDEEKLVSVIEEIRKLSVKDLSVPPIITKIQQEIADSLHGAISLNTLAERCGMSKYYMCHLFKTHTGTGIIGYRNELRMTKAKKALISSDEKISAIASSCGFDNVSYFSEVFTSTEGVSPSAYRKLHQ